MPVSAPTLLTSGFSNANATSYTTASITPSADKLVLCLISSKDSDPPVPTVTGNGLSWDAVVSSVAFANGRKVFLFRAMGAAPSSGAVTIDFGAGNTQVRCSWIICEFGDVDTGGTNGSDAIVQSASDTSGAAASFSVPLAVFQDATNNAAYGGFCIGAAQAITEETGYTEIADVSHGGEAQALQAESKTGEDTSVSASTSPNAAWGGVAVEIKAAAAADGTPARANLPDSGWWR